MTLPQPDKWVRKAVRDAFNNTVVNGDAIPVYDSRVPNNSPTKYVVMGQQNTEERRNKSQYFYWHSLLLEVVTRTTTVNNTANRQGAEDIQQALRLAINNLTLDPASGLTVLTQVYTYPGDLIEPGSGETFVRKFLRLELHIY